MEWFMTRPSRSIPSWLLLAAVLFLSTACAGTSNKTATLPGSTTTPAISPVAVPPPSTPPPQGVTTGSLWTNRSGNLTEDVKAHRVGDIVTITVSEKAEATKKGSTKTGRSKDFSG